MATIREKGLSQWQAQIRRKGWPYQNATFCTKKEAQAWARSIKSDMDRGVSSTSRRVAVQRLAI